MLGASAFADILDARLRDAAPCDAAPDPLRRRADATPWTGPVTPAHPLLFMRPFPAANAAGYRPLRRGGLTGAGRHAAA